MADHPGKLSESEERQQQYETHDADGQKAPGIPPEKWWKALDDSVSVEQTYCGTLDDVKDDKNYAEDERLVKDRVDEWFAPESSSEVEMLSDEKDLCEDEGVHDRESMLLSIQMMLRHDDALVDGEQSEDDPEIEKDDEKAPEFYRGFLFEGRLFGGGGFGCHVRTSSITEQGRPACAILGHEGEHPITAPPNTSSDQSADRITSPKADC